MFTNEFLSRFKSRSDESPSGCLMWTGNLDYKGYGAISFNGKMLKAHRVAFFIEHGRWPKPCALHTCDTPACIRPSHIFEGTPAENSADMVRKGRVNIEPRTIGTANPSSKVTPQAVRAIRALYSIGLPTKSISAKFGISTSQVRNIGSRRHWSHIK